MKHRGLTLFIGIAVAGMLTTACSDDTDTLYANLRAFLRYNKVATTPQLFTAVNNPGMFCTVSFPNGRYVFTDADGRSTTYQPVAGDVSYGRPECVAGFIIGRPAIPDMSGTMSVTAYDLVCRNCYSDDAIQRSLSFASPTTMSCPRCHRTYDLNNGGIVISGEAGSSLYRYRVTYSEAGNTIVIQN